MLQEERLQNAWKRHAEMHKMLKNGLSKLGIEYCVDPSCCLPILNLVKIPDGIEDAKIRATLLNDYNLEIGAGLADFSGSYWRIGLMGASATKQNVALCLSALENVLSDNDNKV